VAELLRRHGGRNKPFETKQSPLATSQSQRTMNTRSFVNRLRHSPIPIVAVALLAWACSSLAFCGEIHVAARNGDLANVQALLKSNPNLVFSKDDQHGATPLLWAAAMGRKDVVELLLANKADVNAQDKRNLTALH
jgi:ankyrin repeat protein